jgi:hypothetical protein
MEKSNMSVNEIESAALQLDIKSRAKLASLLLESLEGTSEKEIELLWVEEALRRDAAIEAGTLKEISGDEAFRDVLARLRK